MIAAAEAAYIIRSRESRMDFNEVTLELGADMYEPFKEGVPGPVRVVTAFAVRLLGRVLPLGYLEGHLPASDMKVARATPIAGADPPTWAVRLEPATEAARHPVFHLHREHPVTGERPAASSSPAPPR
jgi:hypothetical protein